MGIIIDEYKKVAAFITGPHIPLMLGALSFLSGFPYFFFLWGNVFFLGIFFEMILWMTSLILASAAGFSMSGMRGKRMLDAALAGAKTTILLHVPRHAAGSLASILGYAALLMAFGASPEPELLVFQSARLIGIVLIASLAISGMVGLLSGAAGGLLGRWMGEATFAQRPTRKSWK